MADVAAVEPENAEAGNPKKRPREPATAPLPDELSLPMSSVMRIVKARLPDGMMVGTDTKKAISKACSLFVLYISTMCAARPNFSPRCQGALLVPVPRVPSPLPVHVEPLP